MFSIVLPTLGAILHGFIPSERPF